MTDVGDEMSANRLVDSSSPMKCICNLCDCGAHSCSNFHLRSERSGELVDSSRASTDNRCAKYAPKTATVKSITKQQKHSSRKSSPAREMQRFEQEIGTQTDECSSADDGDYDDCDERADEECRCLNDEERYLTTPLQPSRATSTTRNSRTPTTNGDRQHVDDHELMHVLITKPEIASKPRDNIVFEGDMDLKTTFETSYEALAKMRLDHWKKYQESKGQHEHEHEHEHDHWMSSQTGDRHHQAVKSTTTTSCRRSKRRGRKMMAKQVASADVHHRSTSTDRDLSHHRHHHHQEQQQDVSVIPTRQKPSTGKTTRGAGVDFGSPGQVLKPEGTKQAALPSMPPSKARRPIAASEGRAIINNERRQAAVANATTPTAAAAPVANVTATVAGSVVDVKKARPGAAADGQNKDIPIDYNYNYTNIDPDLSPIIVYDTNMDRLEKVGLRKRSKYRPSTSLRCGARGLFGDQEEEEVAIVEEAMDMMEENVASAESAASLAVDDAKIAKADTNLRQSRLKRTCQNKNFDISNNQYPEARPDRFTSDCKSKSATNVKGRASPQSKLYNNLFRESPDFILTTGKFMDEEARWNSGSRNALPYESARVKGQPNDSQQIEGCFGSGTLVEENESDENNRKNLECRVLKLDEDFQYVGSQLGHKYFVEKANK